MALAFSRAFTRPVDDPAVGFKTLNRTHPHFNSLAKMSLIRATLLLSAALSVSSMASTSSPDRSVESMAQLFHSVEVVINHLVKSRDLSKKEHSRTSELSRSLLQLEKDNRNFGQRRDAQRRRDKRQLSGVGGFGSNGFQQGSFLSIPPFNSQCDNIIIHFF